MNIVLRHTALLGSIFLLSSTILFGQYRLDPNKTLEQYNYNHWDSKEGLPDNAVIHIIQSKDGYIWMASYGGITRFNGIDFLTYSAYNTPAIINNSFTYIYEDNAGVIWTATSGNGAVTVDNGQLKIYTIHDGLPSNFTEEIVQDQDGRIWIATSDGLAYKEGKTFKNQEAPEPLKKNHLKSIDVDDKNNLWVATTNRGLYQVKSGKIVHHYTESNGLLSNNINYIKVEHGNQLWIGSDQGLSILSNGEFKNLTIDDGIPNNMISSSFIDHNGMPWIGSFRGMGRMADDGSWSYFSQSHPLYENDFTSMVQDSEGNVWIGTYRQGLYKLWDGKFTNYSQSSASDLQPYIVHCIIKRDDQSLYIINETSIDILYPDSNKLIPLDIGHDFSDTKLKFGLKDSRGRLWVATQDYLIKYENGQSTKIDTETGLVNNSVRVLFEDANKNIWAGTTNGISIIKPDNTIKNYSVADGLSHEYIMSIQSDDEGKIWIGTRNGLNVYDQDQFKAYYIRDGMAGEFVFKTFQDSDGVFWICGNAGLTRLKGGKFTKITTQNGLPSNTLFQMLEDEKGNFWFTTNQKNITVFRVHKSDLNAFADGKTNAIKSTLFTQADGLKSTSATSSAMSYKDEEGRLFFATSNGVEMIDPTNIEVNQKEPPVKIETFNADGKFYRTDSAITIPSGKNRVTITFAALSYIAPNDVKYKYKLEGYDDAWLTPDKKLETTYTNLPYGDYTFKVRAANSDGIWNEEGAMVSFYVKPSFYQTNGFIILCIVAAVLLVVIVYKLRVKSLENAKAELAKMVEIRTKEVVDQKEEIEKQKLEIEKQQQQIEEKNKELQKININLEDIVQERTEQLKSAYNELLEVNAEFDTFIYRSVHDVRGPLARLQGLSHLLSLETTDENITKLVNRLNNTADEMNEVFFSLLNIARLKASEIKEVNIDIDQLIGRIVNKIQEVKEVDVKIEKDEQFNLKSDEEILEVLLYQLIDNALKFGKNGTTAQVIVECTTSDNSGVSIQVKDNGVGIPKTVADKIFDMFFVGQDEVSGTGLGLYTVKTATKVLKGEVKLKANAIDGGYTIFELTLPQSLS